MNCPTVVYFAKYGVPTAPQRSFSTFHTNTFKAFTHNESCNTKYKYNVVDSGAESTLNVGAVFQHFSQFFGNFRKWGCIVFGAITKFGVSYQLKLIKMHARLYNLNNCAVPFLSRAAANFCWYYISHNIRCRIKYSECRVGTKTRFSQIYVVYLSR